jgi:hypothetical protein
MNIFLDFETFYSREYSLRKMTAIEYVRDPRFKVLGCAIAINNAQPGWYTPEEFKAWLHVFNQELSTATIICHNTNFDGIILEEHFGIKPHMWGDTLSMARALLPIEKRDLASVAKILGFEGKIDGYLTEGSNEADEKLIAGGLRDVELCRKIYNKLLPYIPESELKLIDLTVRCSIESHIQLNKSLLTQSLQELIAERNQTITDSGYPEEELVSNQKFARILRDLDVSIPQKLSATTGEQTDAFSKNDPEFQTLMADHPPASSDLGRPPGSQVEHHDSTH